ncbi:MAG: hypothetical protein KIT58_06730 [Planctomycetota bacterium]|nr:hypothetical protein [Planctomycetota bacterium]
MHHGRGQARRPRGRPLTRDAVLAARWIVGPRFDLAWFFGGALVAGLAVPALLALGVSIVAIFWGWLLLVDGPHLGATLVRTYADRQEWRERRALLLGSLAAFLVGPLFLLAGALTGSRQPFTAYLGLAALYGFFHVVRQHWGFVALYRAKNGEHDRPGLDAWTVYVGCWAPYLHFMLVHPLARTLVDLPPEPGPVARGLAALCVVAFALAALSFVVRARGASLPRAGYVLLTLGLYGAIYFGVARLEPIYDRPRGPDEAFMLISVMTAVFHGVQYVALVAAHGARRYAAPGVDFGPARALAATPARLVVTLLLFSLGPYLGMAVLTGVFPGLHPFSEATLGPVSVNEVGLCLWWGQALHHYVLDARIWRVRGDARLRRDLGLA